MNPVLIYTNTEKIASDKSALSMNLELFQSIYDVIKAIGITPTLSEINGLLGLTIAGNGAPDFETDYAINKLLDAAAPYILNGVQLQRSKVKEMIVVPDTAGLKAALAEGRQFAGVGADLNLLVINGDVISKVNNSDAIIESRSTHYTLTDASAALANTLQTICDSLNGFDASYDGRIYKNLAAKSIEFEKINGRSAINPLKNSIWGIEMRGGQFAISLSSIRAFERSSSN